MPICLEGILVGFKILTLIKTLKTLIGLVNGTNPKLISLHDIPKITDIPGLCCGMFSGITLM